MSSVSLLKHIADALVVTAFHCYTVFIRVFTNTIHSALNMSATALTTSLLLVDDDMELADMLQRYFARDGYALHHVSTLAELSEAMRAHAPELLILDLMLPDGNGLDACREVRGRDAAIPILILTARGDPIDRVIGLEVGADDYVPKPFDARELLARVRALLRRARSESASHADAAAQTESRAETKMSLGSLTIDFAEAKVSIQGRIVSLTSIEFRLLSALARESGTALSRDALAEASQPGNYRPLERAVDVQIARLRKKMRDIAGADCIVTVRGEGYALVAPPYDVSTSPREK
jgi:DNA-binding response OmpR family regulator